MNTGIIPVLIGYLPEDAEKVLAEYGLACCWVDSEKPKWLSANHQARVGRQRLQADGTIELLRVYIPILTPGDEIAVESE